MWVLLTLLTLATGRVTWFITEDHLPLIEKPRNWIVNRNPAGSLAYLVQCWFCVSIYIAAGAAAFAVWVLNMRFEIWANIAKGNMFQQPAGWKCFLVLWPALSFAGVGVMGAIDWLTNAPEHD